MKYLILLILIVNGLYTMEPIVKINPLPQDETLEAYEESEELFVLKVMEYYTSSVMLKTQLESFDIIPDEKVKSPSLEELNDMELDVIIKYYNIARSLEGQVESVDYKYVRSEIYQLKDSLNNVQSRFIDSLWGVRNSFLQRELAIKNQRDSICNERVIEIEDKINSGCKDCKNFFSVDVSQNLFLVRDENVETKPNVGVRIALNTSKLLGFGKSFRFWYEYQAPRYTTSYTYMETRTDEVTVQERWNSHLSAMGISTSFFPVVSMDKVNSGLQVGVGYFWGEGTVYNSSLGSYYWEGAKVDFEYFVGVNSARFPFELFLSGSLYQSLNEDFKFDVNYNNVEDRINIGASQFRFNIGLRYNFWSSSF